MTKRTIHFFIDKMKSGEYFSQAGYSDAEWYCMLNVRGGEKTGLGQVLSNSHGARLTEILVRRRNDSTFIVAVPQCLFRLPQFDGNRTIDIFLRRRRLATDNWCERDMITDSIAEKGKLFPLISQLVTMPVVIIGNRHLKGLDFLQYKNFVEISSPNLHLEPNGIERAVEEAVTHYSPGTIYLVSAGVSAAVIIDKLHDITPKSFKFDCGSIWDAFVGIGAQREWRANLYADEKAYEIWVRRNITGK